MFAITYLPSEVGYSEKNFKFNNEPILAPEDVSLTLSTVPSNVCLGFEVSLSILQLYKKI